MGHIHREPGQHDHTVSAYILRTDFDEPKLLLHMHKLLRVWMQPGGHVELNETPWQSMAHELLEETGYDLDQLKILQPGERLKHVVNTALHPVPVSYLTHTFDDLDHYHTDVAFAFVTDQQPAHPVGDGEAEEFKLVTRQELKTVDTIEGVREIGRFVFDVAYPSWEQVSTSEFTL